MVIALYLAVPVLIAFGLLWWVNRRNPGDYRTRDMSAHDKGGMEQGWSGRVDPDRRQGRP